MGYLPNARYRCKLYKRLPNSSDEIVNEPITFKAELVSEKERTYNQRILNLLTPQTRLVLRTASPLIYETAEAKEVKGYVEFQNDIYQIQNISFDHSDASSISGDHFTKKRNEKNAVKILVLV